MFVIPNRVNVAALSGPIRARIWARWAVQRRSSGKGPCVLVTCGKSHCWHRPSPRSDHSGDGPETRRARCHRYATAFPAADAGSAVYGADPAPALAAPPPRLPPPPRPGRSPPPIHQPLPAHLVVTLPPSPHRPVGHSDNMCRLQPTDLLRRLQHYFLYLHHPLHCGPGIPLHALLPPALQSLPCRPLKRTLHLLFPPDISCATDTSSFFS